MSRLHPIALAFLSLAVLPCRGLDTSLSAGFAGTTKGNPRRAYSKFQCYLHYSLALDQILIHLLSVFVHSKWKHIYNHGKDRGRVDYWFRHQHGPRIDSSTGTGGNLLPPWYRPWLCKCQLSIHKGISGQCYRQGQGKRHGITRFDISSDHSCRVHVFILYYRRKLVIRNQYLVQYRCGRGRYRCIRPVHFNWRGICSGLPFLRIHS